MEVTVIRSARRRKTAQARLVDGHLEVRVPARLPPGEEARLVEDFRRKFDRRSRTETVDLDRRARSLAARYDLPEPVGIRWVSNQRQRWGSCTPATGQIRITDRLAGAPDFVLDAVIVHELAHLVERGHTARFRQLMARFPLAERAEGYLIALAGMTEPDADPFADDLPTADDAPVAAVDRPAPTPVRPSDVAGPANAPRAAVDRSAPTSTPGDQGALFDLGRDQGPGR